jgi:hypothetical protein
MIQGTLESALKFPHAGMTTPLYFDENGERMLEYAVDTYAENNTEVRVLSIALNVTCWTCDAGVQSTLVRQKMFLFVEFSKSTSSIQAFNNVLPGFWSMFPPPPDMPACGFAGELCSYTNIILIVCACIVLCILAALGYYWLRWW